MKKLILGLVLSLGLVSAKAAVEYDVVKSIDLTATNYITASLLNQLVDTAKIGTTNKGIVIRRNGGGGSYWPDVTSNPRYTNFLWVDTATSPGTLKQYVCCGDVYSNWVSTVVTPGSVTTTEILDFTITDSDLGTNSVSDFALKASSVSGNKIADNGILAGKLSLSSVILGNYAFGSIVGGNITNNTITDTNLADSAVTRLKIAPNAIYANHLSNNIIQNQHLSNGIVYGTNIADGTITSIVGGNITNNTITDTNLADSAVTRLKIAPNAIYANHLSNNIIQNQHLSNGIVYGTNIADGTITSNNIANGTINTNQLGSNVFVNLPFAWGVVNGGALAKGYNVSGVTAAGTGRYFVNFINNAPDTNYCIQVLGRDSASVTLGWGALSNTVSSFLLVSEAPDGVGYSAADAYYFVIFAY